MNKTGMIILAAGSSSRLGRPKQLLPFRGKTLLLHVVTEALAAGLQPVVVVTGAYHGELSDELNGQTVHVVHNPLWETGMASGIASGLVEAVSQDIELRAVMVAVCDQPYVSGTLFRSLMEQQAVSGKGLVACTYAETMGTPVLFDARYFKELAGLSGKGGAQQLLKRYPEDVVTVPFPEGTVDIDTEEDFRRLNDSI